MLDGERRHRAVGREKEEAALGDENCWRERDGDSWKEKLALSDEDRAVSCRWCERERSAGKQIDRQGVAGGPRQWDGRR